MFLGFAIALFAMALVLFAILLFAQANPSISTREIVRAMALAVFAFSAVVCHGVAKMKGKNQISWTAFGFLFGPFAVAYLLLTPNVFAGANETLNQRVDVFLKLGLLGKDGDREPRKIVQTISRKYIEEWGMEFHKDERNKKDSLHADLKVLEYGGANIWWKDTEADVLKGNATYVKTLKELSTISNGVFSPSNITESWKTDEGPIEITFQLNNKNLKIVPKYLEDYLDMNVLKQINKMLSNTDNRYEMVAAFDQSAVVLWINSETKAALIRRGWGFAW
ncbi:MAG: hypothetical protein A2140_09650 [Candidatus Muproteobacteria bacterium RBG_16_62_13]|uniref:Uncharacterized protein n=1 Tax=Candidatus Muproteobacteria bacterium RBG_16_62_13 TaxID=1817756 RepID=A0A1F6T4P5_9PROT|nr:MAG: hypothetical protein A2140_09650 [Candidatus Muproteobacteria bacterium RBG_16_62_13]